ncbi:putative N-acetylgalactosaminyl-diphosphoundecaprenol glucuronosyltransferase (plasmid) [Sinorhizobium sojae CCBAU 05684]|uniref:Putative N-acetylgalactosaminyl-diphosphoundecaprenol glucuronosyltransferase n=1 Tax=Sinorhizobium sojae CCBAU 05684 TaxID=716928 RepID=A0A249PJ65_9HYPH|nr:glycosyltransferase family A protein [Sinorhizobium sojae]ASY65980.1 putative N-acetylgalactosaminyl-diphosphoundecaprenol glucuronosyltransferase [Sinorhizobium sojae CCBAU 05684]
MTANVSVILPTFNRTRSLAAAMMSVLNQSYEDLELIVVDDGSVEDVEGLVRSIRDERVMYIRRNKNGGAAAARNTGLARANGNYIAFQDSDDLWLPGKLMRQLALFSTLPEHVGVVTGAKIIYGRDASYKYGPGKVAYAPPPERCLGLDEDQLGRLLCENRIGPQLALFRRNCIPGTTWFDNCARANEDWEFAIRLVQHTTVYEDIEPVVLGFISNDSISSSSRKQTMGLLRILRKNRDVLRARKTQRSRLMIDLAISLYKFGKRRWARKILIAGLRDHPAHIGSAAASAGKMARNTFFGSEKHGRPHPA